MPKYGVNRVILVGNLGADPEIRATTNGTPVGSLRVAVTEPGYNGAEDHTTWHDVVVWAGLAEAACGLKKGDPICVEGSLQTRSWEKDGQKLYRTEIKATFVGAPLEKGAPARRKQQSEQRPASRSAPREPVPARRPPPPPF